MTCSMEDCQSEPVHRLTTTCECLFVYCDSCRDGVERVLLHHLVSKGEGGVCKRCRHPLNPGRASWHPLRPEDLLTLSGPLVADIEHTLRGIA